MTDQRWAPVVSERVTEHVLSLRADEDVRARFFAKVDFGFTVGDCHVWTGALSSEGYGVFALPRAGATKRVVRAHRFAWLCRFDPPPAETPFLDHATTCVGRFCVNVAHLEPVDNAENTRRAVGTGSAPQRALRWAELERREQRRATGEWGIF